MTLRISPPGAFNHKGLVLPDQAVTQTFGILAVRRAGKSNAAAVMAEEMFRAKLPFVVIDPKGDWWGLRSSGSGDGPGLQIPIFGGEHGDVPLEQGGGAFLAQLIVEERLSCVIDVSELSEGAKTRFLIDFAEKLYRTNREPLHLFLEEADDFIPQKPFREQARCVGAWERIVKRGGFRGLGCTLITQRSAVLNKNVLTQVETLIIMRTTSPQDRKAIEGWIEHQGQSKEILATLPGLESGEAWIYSPHFLGLTEPVRIRFPRRSTFDSGATPGVKAKKRPATLADVDLGKIRTQMAETIERAKAADPKELQRRVAELERELKAERDKKPAPERVEIPVIKPEELETLAVSCAALGETVGELRQSLERVANAQGLGLRRDRDLSGGASFPDRPSRERTGAIRHTERSERLRDPISRNGHHGSDSPVEAIGVGERKILLAIAQHPKGLTREQLGIITGYRRSTRNTYLQRLAAASLVTMNGDRIHLTNEGGTISMGENDQPPPTGAALREFWLDKLGQGGERRILEFLIEIFPKSIEREALSEQLGYARSSRNTYLQRLAAGHLVTSIGTTVRASDELF